MYTHKRGVRIRFDVARDVLISIGRNGMAATGGGTDKYLFDAPADGTIADDTTRAIVLKLARISFSGRIRRSVSFSDLCGTPKLCFGSDVRKEYQNGIGTERIRTCILNRERENHRETVDVILSDRRFPMAAA